MWVIKNLFGFYNLNDSYNILGLVSNLIENVIKLD